MSLLPLSDPAGRCLESRGEGWSLFCQSDFSRHCWLWQWCRGFCQLPLAQGKEAHPTLWSVQCAVSVLERTESRPPLVPGPTGSLRCPHWVRLVSVAPAWADASPEAKEAEPWHILCWEAPTLSSHFGKRAKSMGVGCAASRKRDCASC